MFHKDTFRLIRKTAKRFVTIVLIVLIGVAFMVGLMSSSPTMRRSVDVYFDDTNFMDVQLFSSYGFDNRDIVALRKSPQTDSVYPTRFVDTYVSVNDRPVVTRVQECDSYVNRIVLVEGRMPQKSGEALALGSSSFASVYSIGDTVKVYLEDDDISETLAHTEFEIVGIAKSPQYMASSRETSTLNNLTLDTVIFVDDSEFLTDYYTSVYLTLKGAAAYQSFTQEYKDFVSNSIDELNSVIKSQQTVRRDETIEEVTKEIEDGEKEMEEEISKAQKEIDDGRQELEDAYIQILVAEAQIESSEKQLAEGEKELIAGEKELADGEKQINDAKKQIEDETDMPFEEASATIQSAYGIYVLAERLSSEESNATVKENLEARKAERDALRSENTSLTAENLSLTMTNNNLTDENNSLTAENSTLTAENLALEETNKQLEADGEIDRIAANKIKIAENSARIAENTLKISLNQQEITANNTKKEANSKKIAENNEEIDRLDEEISSLESISGFMGNAILAEIPEAIDEMFGGDVKKAYDGVIRLEAAEDEINAAKKQLESGRQEIEAGKQQLADAKKQLTDGRVEYEKGKKELEDGQKELDEKREEARIELAKARQELAELPDAEWMVLDRDSHYSTYMFENNSDQMAKIGYVFPILFFLVAALVCMTTMKRLVDEERSQIGVFSALGFSKNKIASKYVIYALTASLFGSVIAIPVGMAIFPTVIYFCWRLMYDLPDMVLTMPLYIAVLGVCSFTLLMITVTYTVAKTVLKENPSRLMRPKAPRNAKKVFLENIPFIWHKMSFTSKVTARNIIRYKSRFFMTVIGVAGCTSLLVLGFALKGSISQVVSIQYGDIITYDTTITLEDKDYMQDVLDRLDDDEDVQLAVPFMTYSSLAYMEDEDKAIQVYVMDEKDVRDAFDLRQRKDHEPLNLKKGAVISEKFSKLYDIAVGDEIVIESSNGIKKAVEISGICEMYTQHYLFISEDMYQDTFEETVAYDNIAVTNTDGADISSRYENIKGVDSVSDFTAMKATFNNMFGSLDIIIVVIILAAGSLALVVIMNLTEVNISERIREIATLKVLGFNNSEVYSYIFKEVFVLSLIGILVGLPFGRLELIFVMDIIDMEMVMFPTLVQPSSYLFAFLITLTFTVLVILLMRKTLRNVQMVESLKSVE